MCVHVCVCVCVHASMSLYAICCINLQFRFVCKMHVLKNH